MTDRSKRPIAGRFDWTPELVARLGKAGDDVIAEELALSPTPRSPRTLVCSPARSRKGG
ncbi:MAG: hypothetical protein GY842_06230 [bacterium]|nr:hypothetical protein [bacterium]